MSSISSSSSFIAPVAKRPPYQCNSSQSSSSRSYASRASPSLAFRYQRSGWLPDSDSSDSDSEVSSYPLSQNRKRSLRHVSQRQFRRPRHLRQPVPPLLGGKGGGGREDPALLAARVNMETAQGVFDSTTMNAAFYQGLAVCFTLLATLFLLVAWQVDAVALLTLPTKKGDNATITVAISDPMTSIPDSFLAYLQGNSFIAFGITWISIIGASTSLLASICICYGSNIRKAMPNGLKSFMSGHADRAHQLLHRILNGSGTFSKYGSLGIKLWWIFFLGLPTFAAAAFHALAFLDQMRSLSSATAGGKELDGRIAYGLSTLFACVAGTLMFLASILAAASQVSKVSQHNAQGALDDAINEHDRLPPARKQWQDDLRGQKAQRQWQDDLQGQAAAPPQYEQYGSSNAVPMRSEAGYPVGSEFTIATRQERI